MYWLISSTIYLQSLVHEYFLIWQLNTACLNVYICNYNDWSPTEQYLIVSSLWENSTRALRAVGKFYYRKGIWKVYERDLVLIFTIFWLFAFLNSEWMTNDTRVNLIWFSQIFFHGIASPEKHIKLLPILLTSSYLHYTSRSWMKIFITICIRIMSNLRCNGQFWSEWLKT